MEITISDILIDRVIKLRGAAIGNSKAQREQYKEIIAVMVDRLLRWAITEIQTKGE